MMKSLFVAALVAGGVAAPVGPAQAHPGGDEGGQPASPTEMAQMHERVEQGNPGMARMHELMEADNPGIGQLCELMRQGAPERA